MVIYHLIRLEISTRITAQCIYIAICCPVHDFTFFFIRSLIYYTYWMQSKWALSTNMKDRIHKTTRLIFSSMNLRLQMTWWHGNWVGCLVLCHLFELCFAKFVPCESESTFIKIKKWELCTVINWVPVSGWPTKLYFLSHFLHSMVQSADFNYHNVTI